MKEWNSHLGERVERLRLFIWVVAANLALVTAAAIAMGLHGGRLLAVLGAGLLLALLLAWVIELLVNRGSRGAVNLWSATAAPAYRHDYSDVEALIVRGRTGEAIDRYRDIVAARPAGVEPRIRLALLLLDHDAAAAEAAAWLLSARACDPDAAEERRIGNALIDLYRSRDQLDLMKAELARFARLNRGTGPGRAARAALRQMVADEASRGD